MVLMEVEFVTGWEAENPDSLTSVEEVQRVETDKEENKVFLNDSKVLQRYFCLSSGCVIFQ